MCLKTVKETFDTPSDVIIDARKQFGGTVKEPRFSGYTYKGSNKVPLDRWITAEETTVFATDGNQYTTGFHVITDEAEAKNGGYDRRVYVRKIHTVGTQDSLPCVIAKEMYVPSNPDAWPPKAATIATLKEKIFGGGGSA